MNIRVLRSLSSILRSNLTSEAITIAACSTKGAIQGFGISDTLLTEKLNDWINRQPQHLV